MTDDVCGCSVSEKEEEESKYADSHKILVFNRPEDKKQKENETPELYAEFKSSVFLGLMLTISWWWWMYELYDILILRIIFLKNI